jgi:hypothetical protein
MAIDGSNEAATTTRANNAISVSVGSVNATFAPADANGNATSLDNDGNVRLKVGDKIKIRMAGFLPNSNVETWMFSSPVLLGRTKVDAKGTINSDFVIPASMPNGRHRIAISARTADNKPTTIGLGVMVGEPEAKSKATVLLIVIPVTLAVLGGLLLPAVTRRRRRS